MDEYKVDLRGLGGMVARRGGAEESAGGEGL